MISICVSSISSVSSSSCFDSVYVALQYDEIYPCFTAGPVCLGGVCSQVIVFVLSVTLSWYPIWLRWCD